MLGIVDVHQHLIYPDRYEYPWTAEIPRLAGRAFPYEAYLSAAEGCGIGATVFMEAGAVQQAPDDEATFVRSLDAAPSCPIVGMVVACHPENEGFEDFLADCIGPRIVGLRRILHVEDDQLSRSPRFRDNVRLLGPFGLTFDLCFLARQLRIAAELAAACPNVTFVLDHCGVPDIAANSMTSWRADIQRLADLPNVVCKVSGLLAYCDPDRADRDAVAPSVEHCIHSFGWDRVVWGSDWPLVEINSTLRGWVAICSDIVEGESEANRVKLFSANALSVYGIDEGAHV